MRRILAFLAAWLLLLPATAQITVELSFDQDQYIAYESLVAVVKVTNFSGRTLKLGSDPDWLRFEVEGENGTYVHSLGQPPVVDPFELPTASKATRRIDLAPYFMLRSVGRYRVTAVVRVPEPSQVLSSKAQHFNIVLGTRLWEQDYGLPVGTNGTDTVARKYALIQGVSQKVLKLYVLAADATETEVSRVFPVGPLLSISRPEAQIDTKGRLHILYQTGARSFTYVMVRGDGALLLRQTHNQTPASRPYLKVDSEGKIAVRGGLRIANKDDVPKPVPAGDQSSESTNAPAKDEKPLPVSAADLEKPSKSP